MDENNEVLAYTMLELEDKMESWLKPACRTLYMDDLCVDESARCGRREIVLSKSQRNRQEDGLP